MLPALILALVALGFAALRLWGYRRQMEEMAHVLEETPAESNLRLTVGMDSAPARRLCRAVNRRLEEGRRLRAESLKGEQELRYTMACISHDIRTPLAGAMGYLQLLEGEGLSPEKKGEYLAVIEGRARTLQTFIAAFYDLSRIEGGELPLEREKVDLGRALSDQLAAAYEQIEASGLVMDVDVADHLPPVWADSGAVTRIFSNLLTNALRHGKGALTIRLYREENTIVSSFSNRADCLTAEDAAHVFERFYTADKMRTGQSTGLGLAIVKALAERMGHTAAARWENGVFTVEVRWSI